MTQIQLQQGQAQAPYIAGVSIVVPAVGVGVETFGAHVCARADVRVTGVQRAAHDLADSEIRDLHLHLVVHQQVGGFQVPVNDLVPVEVTKPVENLARDVCELRF